MPKPQFVQKTSPTLGLTKLQLDGLASSEFLLSKLKAGLTPLGRPEKAAELGFFEQGIRTGAIVIFGSILSTATYLAYNVISSKIGSKR